MRLTMEEANEINENSREREGEGERVVHAIPTLASRQTSHKRKHLRGFRCVRLLHVSRQCTADASTDESRKRGRHRVDQVLEYGVFMSLVHIGNCLQEDKFWSQNVGDAA